jgi:hypothetical protein
MPYPLPPPEGHYSGRPHQPDPARLVDDAPVTAGLQRVTS